MDEAAVDPVLVQLVLDAIPATLAAIGAAHPGERLTGYALGTDDDVCGVFHVALTAERSRPDHRFSFVDWPYAEGAEHLERAAGHASASYDAAEGDAFPGHVRRCFASFVEALAIARERGIFADEVFLDVGSTDPAPHMDELEEHAVLRLNRGAVLRGWCLQHIAWAEHRIANAPGPPRYYESYREEVIAAARARIEHFRRIMEAT